MVSLLLHTFGVLVVGHPVCIQVLGADIAELILLPNLAISCWYLLAKVAVPEV
jgi:uncharacterized membrane protein